MVKIHVGTRQTDGHLLVIVHISQHRLQDNGVIHIHISPTNHKAVYLLTRMINCIQ